MWRRRRDQPDPHELAAERLNAGLAPFEPLPPQLHAFNRKRLLLFVLLGAVTVAVLRDGLGRGAPPVHGSCTRPAFAFDKESVRVEGVVQWSVAGPAGSYVIITADSTSASSGRVVGPVPLKGCKGSGRFGVTLKDGKHVLRVFLRSEAGTTTLVGKKPLEVDAPH